MTDRLLLALDQGTSSSRAIVFDEQGRIVRQARRELRQHFPQPGQVEHDPEEIWSTQLATAREVLAQVSVPRIAAVGITNQRETTIVWDRRTGQPIHNAIVWQDRRTEAACAALRAAGHEPIVRERTGLVIDPYFSATKIAWILDHVPGARERALRGELAFGTVDTWLMWRLSAGRLHCTDTTNASRTMLFDIRRGCWDADLCERFGIPMGVLPEVLPSAHRYGDTDPSLFGVPLRIGGVAGDQQAALFGQACVREGMAKNTYGTGCFMLLHTGERFQTSSQGLVTTPAAQVGAHRPFAFEGSVFIAGAVVQWLRDNLGAFERSADVERLAATVPDAGGVVLVPAFTGLGAPHWRASSRGAMFGLTRGATIAHIARAALESIAFQSADLLQAMQKDAPRPITELRVDGGAAANDMLMQFQADLIGVPVVRPRMLETTALGAACLAGLTAGVYRDADDLAGHWQGERSFEPSISRDEAAALMQRWHRAVQAVPDDLG